jgi:hypothetical protein
MTYYLSHAFLRLFPRTRTSGPGIPTCQGQGC